MLQNKFSLIIAAMFAVALTGCGNGGDAAPRVQFSSEVVFGDSLSDVGTYNVGTITHVGGGGLYTVNPTVKTSAINWTELIAADLSLSAPCAAETGLNGSAGFGFSVAPVFHTGCTNYAQGGARVTNPLGPGNAALPSFLGGSAILGQLTVPVTTQIDNYLSTHGGAFSGTEIVFVLAGGNDAIVNTLTYVVSVVQAMGIGGLPAGQAEAAIARTNALTAMSTAGTELAGYVNTKILGKGAKYVVVLNLPDLSSTPFGTQSETLIQGQTTVPFPGTKALLKTMVDTFNAQLAANLTSPNVLLADLNTASVIQTANPREFGLTNVTDPACAVTGNILAGSSLVCNPTNVITGDISHYAFADTVHPTPYGYFLIALFAAQQLQGKGWL